MDIKSVVEKYISLRDEKAQIAARHKEELSPVNESMGVIEKWLLAQMDAQGVDSFKTGAGTPYKAVTKSIKTTDIEAFKRFALQPVVDALSQLPNMPDIGALLTAGIRWDMLDFRPLKKGIVEYTEENGQLPPGVSMDSFSTVNIRRA